MRMVRRPRTLWAVTPILTLPLLARCDQMLGLRSQCLVFTTYYVTRAFDINLQWLDRIAASRLTQCFIPKAYALLHEVIFRWALLRYDVFHFFYDSGLLSSPFRIGINPHEIERLRKAGKRIYMYAYGADVRVRDTTLLFGRYNICRECPQPGKFCICDYGEASRNIANIRESATAMIAKGDMVAYVPGCTEMHYWPIDCSRHKYVGVQARRCRPLRIAHAPNSPHFKGTHYLEEVVSRLSSEGYAVELVQVQGVRNEKVIELFASADLIADQFISDFYGYTALEAMSLGKPVICYIRDSQMLVEPKKCPIINADPKSLYEVVKSCVDSSINLATVGERSRWYVQRYHSLEAVAVRVGKLYLNTAKFPDEVTNRIRERVNLLETRLSDLDVFERRVVPQ
jgi:glycosyltransferase involved in cell wall biosynthesis